VTEGERPFSSPPKLLFSPPQQPVNRQPWHNLHLEFVSARLQAPPKYPVKSHQCQQKSYVLNAVAKGPFHAPFVLALAAGPSRASSSVSAGSAMEAADVAVMSAAVQRK
jgi:hypothetical protein